MIFSEKAFAGLSVMTVADYCRIDKTFISLAGLPFIKICRINLSYKDKR